MKAGKLLRFLSSIILTLVIATSYPLSAIANAATGDSFVDGNLEFTVLTEPDDNGKGTVSVRAKNSGICGNIDIPSTITNGDNSYDVVCIDDNAFTSCTELTGVKVPDSVVDFGDDIFAECENLKSVEFSNSLASIESEVSYPENTKVTIVLNNKISLTEDITIPSNVELTIGANGALIINEGIILTNEGFLINEGSLVINGSIENIPGDRKINFTNTFSGVIVNLPAGVEGFHCALCGNGSQTGKSSICSGCGQDTGNKDETWAHKTLRTFKQLASGFKFTFIIFVFTLLFAIPLGLIVASGRMSRFKIINIPFRVFISILRGTPLMLQLMLVYFLPNMLFHIPLRKLSFDIGSFNVNYRLMATIIGFSLNYSAYFAEIFRSGIQAIPRGQHEAAQILGFSKLQTFFKIVLPQVFKNVLPALTNEIITLVKDTSLAQVLAVTEMFTVASAMASAQVSIMPLIAAGAFYYVMNFVVEQLMNLAEKKMNYYH